MKKYLALLLLSGIIVAGCTTTNSTNTNSSDKKKDDTVAEDDSMMNDSKDEVMEEIKDSKTSDVKFNNYENKATGYSIDIPDNWYWRHFHQSEIGEANPNVIDYVFISPNKSIEGIQTESPAEIVVEVSSHELDAFKDDILPETAVDIVGQAGLLVKGVLSTEMYSNYQKIEYRFSRDDKSYRILYLAPDGFDNNEEIFEQIVKSLKFN